MSSADSEVLHEDLRQLCEAVGIFSGAQDASPHEVFQKALTGVRLLRAVADASRVVYHGQRDPAVSRAQQDWALGKALTDYGVFVGPTVTTS